MIIDQTSIPIYQWFSIYFHMVSSAWYPEIMLIVIFLSLELLCHIVS
jgi:hypothetical protein